ncbi:hypothetical protein C8R42DRAFT_202793 [Lentinula raphanica]|nr:hypothetical protein C8R42DRAFT_202793 [Lentinula raphanica]
MSSTDATIANQAEEQAQGPASMGTNSMPTEPRKKSKNHLLDIAHLPTADGSPNRDRRRIPSRDRHQNEEESPTRRYSNNNVTPLVPDGEDSEDQAAEDVEMRGPSSNNSTNDEGQGEQANGNAAGEFITASQLRDFEMTRSEIDDEQRPSPNPFIIRGSLSTVPSRNEDQAAQPAEEPPESPSVSPTYDLQTPPWQTVRREAEEAFTLADVSNMCANAVRNLVSPVCPNRPTGHPPLSSKFKKLLVNAGIAINISRFERFARDLTVVTKGFSKAQLIEIFSDPDHWAWLIVFNGGDYLYENIPELGFVAQTFLNDRLEAGITRNITPYIDSIALREVHPAEEDNSKKGKKNKPRNGKGRKDQADSSAPSKTSHPDRYTGPIAMAVKFADAGEMRQLFMQQTIGINDGVGFHIIPVTNTDRSHIVGSVRSNQFSCDEGVKNDMIHAIKQKLNNDQGFHRVVAQVVLGSEPTPDKVREITDTIRLRPLREPILFRKIKWPAFGLYMDVASRSSDPFIRDRGDNRIREYIRSLKEIPGTYLNTYIEPMHCTLCKCDTHPTFQCPFTTMETWNGPRGQAAAAVKKYFEAQKA